jgi:uncharacterized protein
LIYLDTSVLVTLLVNESSTAMIRHWYAECNNTLLLTSDWTLTEFASALSLKQGSGQLSASQVLAIQETFDHFIGDGIRLLDVSRQAFRHSTKLIQTMHGLRAGDALHLAVAMEAGIQTFATLDKLLMTKALEAQLQLVRF